MLRAKIQTFTTDTQAADLQVVSRRRRSNFDEPKLPPIIHRTSDLNRTKNVNFDLLAFYKFL
jgi:hypothetical protein